MKLYKALATAMVATAATMQRCPPVTPQSFTTGVTITKAGGIHDTRGSWDVLSPGRYE